MKKYTALFLALVLTLALCACGGSQQPTASSQPEAEGGKVVGNPLTELSYEELLARSDMDFAYPEGGTDISCAVINGSTVIYELEFTYNGDSYCVRAADTAALDETIAGMNYTWSSTGDGVVDGDDPMCWYLEETEGAGLYCWYDDETWTVSMSSGASLEKLEAMCNFILNAD